jgi:hypothetical protein
MKKALITISLCAAFSIICKSQQGSCEALSVLFDSKDLISHFEVLSKKDSVLFLVDRNNNFEKCALGSWGGKRLVILFDTSISLALTKTQPYFLFKDRSNYYIIMEYRQIKRIKHISILNPYSGLVYYAKLKLKKGKYVIVNLRRGVV